MTARAATARSRAARGARRTPTAGVAPKAATVTVALAERSYPIRITSGGLEAVGAAVAQHTAARRAALVTVPPVGRRYAGTLLRSLRAAGIVARRVDVPDGDASKSPRQLQRLWSAFLEMGLDRSSCVIALGGGVVGDLAGFAAATFMRGIDFVQVPTTLLAMVDASVGGKVAINLSEGKNLVGAFHQPRLVWVDVDTLRTLPMRQRAAGMAEVIKAGAIWDAKLFSRLERDVEAALELEPAALLPAIEAACRMKAEVVSRDEREGGLRMLLNFGHTLAHAVEHLTGYRRVLHGEAVGMGMVFAARRSEELGLAEAGAAGRVAELVARAGLPGELPDFPRQAYLRALRVDKKRQDARIHFVALERIGRARTVPLTPAEILPARRAGRTRRGATR